MKRRDFLIQTGLAGMALPGLSWAAGQPCPPPSLSASGGTSANTGCGSGSVGAMPTLTLVSAVGSGTHAWTFGQPFAKGDVPSGRSLVTSEPQSSVIVKRRWNDGSVKHAIVCGVSSFTGGVPKAITFSEGSPSGADLTASNIQAAAPTASVQCGSIGTVTLSPLLGSPFRTWISSPHMVECHYRSAVGNDKSLNVWFHVRLWASGHLWVRAIVENGYIDELPPTSSYSAVVTIGASTVYSGSISHYRWCRWSVEGWIGTAAIIKPSHDTGYLCGTKLVPNYWKRSPSSTALNALVQAYAPMRLGPHPAQMGDAGYSPHNGQMPNWSALYVTSGDGRAYDAMKVASNSFGIYSIFARDRSTQRPMRPSQHPTLTWDSLTGSPDPTNPTATWKPSHLTNEGFAAYLLTGDYLDYETMAFNAASSYLTNSTGSGSGTSRKLGGETRQIAWTSNVIGSFVAIAATESESVSDTSVVSDLQSLLANTYTYYLDQANLPGQNQLGIPYQYSLGAWDVGDGTEDGSLAPWMCDFWVGVNGRISNMDALTDPAPLVALRNHMYWWVIGRLGPSGSGYFHFSRAGTQYGIRVHPTSTGVVFGPDEREFFDSWGDVWTATFGRPNAETTNSLGGSGSSDPAGQAVSQRWGPVMVAMAYAVDHGASGASAAWARLVGADNWSVYENGGAYPQNWHDTPLWGIVPSGFGGT